jgi:hypothetical protein
MVKLLLLIAIAHTMLALTHGYILDLNRRAGGGRGEVAAPAAFL